MSPNLTDTQPEYMAGHPTGTVTATTDGRYISSVQWNDIRGNVLGSKTRHSDGITESETAGYTFTDKLSWREVIVDGLYGGTVTMVENDYYSEVTDDIVFKEILLDHGGEDAGITIGYGYDRLGRLTTVSRPVTNGASTVSYTYDMHGWTKEISTSEGFLEKIFYQDGAGTPCYNGNISSLTWKNSINTSLTRGYAFTYDGADRLTTAAYGEGAALSDNRNRYDETMTYDNNGNVTKLHRCGKMQKGTYGNVDKLTTMEYSGNQLTAIKETADAVTAEGSTDYKGVKNRRNILEYDGCGSLIRDDGRGIALIEYDNMNNPRRIQFCNGNVTSYVYTATGRKLKAVHQTAVPNITVAAGTSHELTAGELLYADSVEYLHDGRLTAKNGRIDKYHFDGGYAQATAAQTGSGAGNFTFHYYTEDHLGNVREVVSEDGVVEQVTNYYPFGTPYSAEDAATLAPTLQDRKYNGKEFDTMHGLSTYDYGARQYCALFARWDRMDQMCEKYYSVSPYVYCLGNPVKNLDEKGEEVKVYVGTRNNPNNKNLYSLGTRLAAHDNPNAIMIVAHGIYAHEDDYGMSNGIRFEAYNPHTKSWKNTDIRNGEEMDRFLSANSNVWKDVKEGKKEASDIQIVLYSCGAGDVAKKISAFPKFEGVTFIAPNDKIRVSVNARDVSIGHTEKDNTTTFGLWNIYTNGLIYQGIGYNGNENLLPGTLNFKKNEKW